MAMEHLIKHKTTIIQMNDTDLVKHKQTHPDGAIQNGRWTVMFQDNLVTSVCFSGSKL